MRLPFTKSARPQLKGPEDRMTLRDHLAELRVRIVRSVLAITIGVIVVMTFYDPILRFIVGPYRDLCKERPNICNGSISAIGPLDGFTTRISISLYGGVILALPVILWQIWRFVVPALHAKEKKVAIPFMTSVIVLFVFGGFVAYWTLGYALEFLITWSGDDVEQIYQVSKYISLVGLMVAAYGVGFEFPVLLVFLQMVGVIKPAQLRKNWRYAVFVIFAIAAIITPSGDPISMMALAVPMTLFYVISILIGMILVRRKIKRGELDPEDDDEDAPVGATT